MSIYRCVGGGSKEFIILLWSFIERAPFSTHVKAKMFDSERERRIVDDYRVRNDDIFSSEEQEIEVLWHRGCPAWNRNVELVHVFQSHCQVYWLALDAIMLSVDESKSTKHVKRNLSERSVDAAEKEPSPSPTVTSIMVQ